MERFGHKQDELEMFKKRNDLGPLPCNLTLLDENVKRRQPDTIVGSQSSDVV